ncbi:MAG: PASTA domain-containing protein [Flavobacteriales bacterium]|nr:PASTA domain-containing protein [Flavobacteriales bacterium]MCL4283210.1 PASTA domain-containing protein [Flavobacteriales bacterium]
MTAKKRLLLILAPVLIAATLLGGAWWWLGAYTRHDEQVKVPALERMNFTEAAKALEALGLRAEVIDSVYSDDVPKGTVVDQDPDSGRFVKPDRTVYVVMNASQPKMLNMPDLVNLSKRQAISVMEIIGLKVEALQYRPDPCLDCVLAQLYKGQPIAPESRIRKGESITLVLGEGQKGEQVPVPDLVGMGFAEMKAVLTMASLNLGLVVEVKGCGNTGCDTALAKVARQFPAAGPENLISPGGLVDVWLTMDTTATPVP